MGKRKQYTVPGAVSAGDVDRILNEADAAQRTTQVRQYDWRTGTYIWTTVRVDRHGRYEGQWDYDPTPTTTTRPVVHDRSSGTSGRPTSARERKARQAAAKKAAAGGKQQSQRPRDRRKKQP